MIDTPPVQPNNPPAPAAPSSPSVPPAPSAATTVIKGTKTEAELQLEKDLRTERDSHATTAAEKKKREIRIAELEDELRTLRAAQSAPAAPAKQSRGMMEKFLSGDDED